MTATATTSMPIEILTREEVGKLLRVCNRRSPSGLRDRALIALMYGSGLRIGEALALRGKDVDLDAGTLRVHRGKGSKGRVCGIEVGMSAILQEWMDYRRTVLDLNGSALIFVLISKGKMGQAVSQPATRQMLKRRANKVGIEKRVHCHGLRHSHASNMASAGIPLNVIQKQLGHSNISTTSRYIDHVQPADVVSAVRAMG